MSRAHCGQDLGPSPPARHPVRPALPGTLLERTQPPPPSACPRGQPLPGVCPSAPALPSRPGPLPAPRPRAPAPPGHSFRAILDGGGPRSAGDVRSASRPSPARRFSERVLGPAHADPPRVINPRCSLWRGEGRRLPGHHSPTISPQLRGSEPLALSKEARVWGVSPVGENGRRFLLPERPRPCSSRRQAAEAVTPRRAQRRRPSSRHLEWRRSRGRRHPERLGRRAGDGGEGGGRGAELAQSGGDFGAPRAGGGGGSAGSGEPGARAARPGRRGRGGAGAGGGRG